MAKMAERIEVLIAGGHTDSAHQYLVETISQLIRQPYALSQNVNYLVHYTSIGALFSLLGCPIDDSTSFSLSLDRNKPSSVPFGFLRLYDTFHANDPSEGTFLVTNAPNSHPFKSKYEVLWQSLEQQTRLPAYITSFRGVEEMKDIDDLVYWRTYGRDGLGCAIGLPVNCLKHFTFVSQVRYGKESVRCTLNYLSKVLDSLSIFKISKYKEFLDFQKGISDHFLKSISPITYLHKSIDFEFEKEVRVVAPIVKPDDTLWCERHLDVQAGVSLRHFTHLPELRADKLLITNSMIVLGPAVRNSKNLQYVLTQRLRQMGLRSPTVCESTIGYRP